MLDTNATTTVHGCRRPGPGRFRQGLRQQHGTWSRYWFPMADDSDREDRAMSQQLASSWVAFARTGDPNVHGQPQWPRYDLKADVMRDFNPGRDGLVHDLEKDRVDYQLKTLRELYKVH